MSQDREEEDDFALPGGVSLGFGPSTFDTSAEDTAPAAPEANWAQDEAEDGQKQMSVVNWQDMRQACWTFICEVDDAAEEPTDQVHDQTAHNFAALNYTTPSELNPTYSEQSVVAASYYDEWNPPFTSFEENGKPQFSYVVAKTIFTCRYEPDEAEWKTMYAGTLAGGRRQSGIN
ncbi:hypothetical protein IAR50_007364 [Cryptococcus sp. DSM 104548]